MMNLLKGMSRFTIILFTIILVTVILFSPAMIFAQNSSVADLNPPNSFNNEYSIGNQKSRLQSRGAYQETAQRIYYSVGIKYINLFDQARLRPVMLKIYYPYNKTSMSSLVIFSHGLGGSYERCDYLGRRWASEGMISVHINHHGCDDSVWKNKIRPIRELKQIYPAFKSGRVHAGDVRFVLDELEFFSNVDSDLAARMDLSQIGVAGYDIGGLGALLLAGQQPPDRGESLYDERVKAVLVMSPPVYSTSHHALSVYNTIQIPTFFVTGTEDNGVIGDTTAIQRRIPFDAMLKADRYLVTYQGADHMIYGGHFLSINGRNDKPFQDNIARISAIYWKAYLNGDTHAYNSFARDSIGSLVNMGRIERKFPLVSEQPNLQAREASDSVVY